MERRSRPSAPAANVDQALPAHRSRPSASEASVGDFRGQIRAGAGAGDPIALRGPWMNNGRRRMRRSASLIFLLTVIRPLERPMMQLVSRPGAHVLSSPRLRAFARASSRDVITLAIARQRAHARPP
jgi:hypothetical protein